MGFGHRMYSCMSFKSSAIPFIIAPIAPDKPFNVWVKVYWFWCLKKDLNSRTFQLEVLSVKKYSKHRCLLVLPPRALSHSVKECDCVSGSASLSGSMATYINIQQLTNTCPSWNHFYICWIWICISIRTKLQTFIDIVYVYYILI